MPSIVKPITYERIKPWILEHHYAKRVPSISWAYGLFVDGILQGVVSYGKPASPRLCKGICGEEWSRCVFELNRLFVNRTAGAHSASFLVGRSLKMLKKGLIIVSYADTGHGHIGYVYQATNWIYTGCTKARTDVKVNGKHARHYDKENIDYSQRQYRSAKHRYVYFTDKHMKKYLKYPIEAYPKGDSRKYSCNDRVESL